MPGNIFHGSLCSSLDSTELVDSTAAQGTPSSTVSVMHPTLDSDQHRIGKAGKTNDIPGPVANPNEASGHPPVTPCECCECGGEIVSGECIECGHHICSDCTRPFHGHAPPTLSEPLPASPAPTALPAILLNDCCKCGHLMCASGAGTRCRKCGHFRCQACPRATYYDTDEIDGTLE